MKLLLTLLHVAFSFWIFSQAPNAQFTASPTSVCVGSPIQFTNQSVAGNAPITTYSWNFGNGETSNVQNPNYIYPSPGTYTVTLAIQAGNGQADAEVKTAYITIHPIPEPSFTMSGNGCTVPLNVTFNNTTTHESGQTYAWNFGNGQTSTNQNPTNVTYNNAGNYSVQLTVVNTNTGCTKTITNPITVSNFQAAISAPTTVCKGESVVFNDNSTVGANSWQWSSSGAGNSTSQNPTFTFLTEGTFSVVLISQNSTSGCSGTATHQITVLPSPTPSFTATPTTGCTPLQVNFTNTSTAGSTFVWNFGDGTTYTGQNPPTHTYFENNSFDVSLTMTSANGCVDSIAYPEMIQLSDPLAQFTATPMNGCSPLDVQFTENSISPDPVNNPITTWKWDFGDGTTYVGQTPPIHTYQVGIYSVKLVIVLQSGCSDTLVKIDSIQVGEIDLVNFSYTPASQCAKRNIQFTNQSTISAPHDSTEVTYHWNFGDGGTSDLKNPHHSYASDTGYFNVTLMIDFRGCKQYHVIPNAIHIKAPISRFTTQTLYCNPASFPVNVAVSDNSIIGKLTDNASMIWRWGDNSITNFGNADIHDADKGSTSHAYSNYGNYTIKQVIHNTTTGCSDSTTTLIHISKTTADFSISNDSICKNNSLTLNSSSSTSTHPFETYVYSMGNGANVSGVNTTYTYTQAGTYTITLVAKNIVGCSDTKIFTPFTVLELPKAVIASSHHAGCSPLSVILSNNSTPQGNGVLLSSFNWSFSDGSPQQTTSNLGTNITHTFTTEGSFNVSLVAQDQFGCVSAPATVTISITKPVAEFTVDTVVCNLESFITSNQTTGFAPLSYQWSIDGVPGATTSNLTTSFNDLPVNNSTHTPHQITLIATDGNGCIHSITKSIIVSTPYANLNYILGGASLNQDGNYSCPPVFVDFEDQSQTFGDIALWEWDFYDNGNISSNQDPSNTYVFPGTYSTTLKITDEFGCTSDTTLIDYLTISGPIGVPSWIQSTDNCGQNVLFDIVGLESVVSIEWNTGDQTTYLDTITFQHTFLDEGLFYPTVTLTDADGCEVIYPMDTITISNNNLNAYFVPYPTEVNIGTSIIYQDQSTATTNPIVNWQWDFGDNSTVSNNSGVNVTYTHGDLGVFPVTLVVTDANGCKSKYTTSVIIKADFDMPNVFTPNGDGINDVVLIFADILEKFDLVILNRWGNVVSEQKDQSGTVFWDGTNNGKDMCHDGVYFYRFIGALKGSGIELKKEGFITLIGSKP